MKAENLKGHTEINQIAECLAIKEFEAITLQSLKCKVGISKTLAELRRNIKVYGYCVELVDHLFAFHENDVVFCPDVCNKKDADTELPMSSRYEVTKELLHFPL